MPTRILIWDSGARSTNRDDGFWKTLCIVYDNEALGLMERLLDRVGWSFKTEKVN